MKRITVTKVLALASGIIAVNEDQFRRRAHNLELIGQDDNKEQLVLDEDVIELLHEEGCAPCRIVKPVMFKVGEVLFLDEVPKATNPAFKTDADLEAEAAAAEEAEAAAEAARIVAEEKEQAEAEAAEAAEAEEAAKRKAAEEKAAAEEKEQPGAKDAEAKKKAPKKKTPKKKA